MNIIYIIIIILTILILIMLGFIFYGIFVKPSPAPIMLDPGHGSSNIDCITQQVTCADDNDCMNNCKQSREGIEMSCVKLQRYSDEQEDLYGKTTGYCSESQPDIQCNQKNGGLLVWSGNNGGSMEWDCLCSYPNYFSSKDCDSLNNDICNPGTFNWDATTGIAPSSKHCTCNNNYVKMERIDSGYTPICVQQDKCSFYLDIAKCPDDNPNCCT